MLSLLLVVVAVSIIVVVGDCNSVVLAVDADAVAVRLLAAVVPFFRW